MPKEGILNFKLGQKLKKLFTYIKNSVSVFNYSKKWPALKFMYEQPFHSTNKTHNKHAAKFRISCRSGVQFI